jgi:N6-L-threonylcarbamoyladenine synthase
MLVLGIESSCDETAAAVVENGRRVLSNVVSSQVDLHREYGGVVPEIASRAHTERMMPVIRAAVGDAGVVLRDIDAVAVGHRPGLIGSLLVGVAAAKALAWSLGVPLVGVDHVHAHLYAALLDRDCSAADVFPALGLVVSGGHSSIYRADDVLSLRRLGSTIDDAIGEAYDKAAAILGLPYPGGPEVDRLAQSDGADDRLVDFPVSRLGRDSLDFSFSGLKTALLYAVQGVPQHPSRGGGIVAPVPAMTERRTIDLAASFQAAAVKAVVLKLCRAMDVVEADGGGVRSLIAGGGVTANSRLRRELHAFASARGVSLLIPAMGNCVDNAAMIAGLGYERLVRGLVDDMTLTPMPTTGCG